MKSISHYMRSPMASATTCVFALFCTLSAGAVGAGCAQPAGMHTWGTTDYESEAVALGPQAEAELAKPIERRSKDAGLLLLDYATCCMSAGRLDAAQRALYEAILLTNDLSLGDASGRASLVFDESMKIWQGEAYERAMIELLHGICLMQLNDFENARVAFDRALVCDRFSKGALTDYEGNCGGDDQFVANAYCTSKGGSLFQRDFLAAYFFRTICYLRTGRNKLADDSWKQTIYTREEVRMVSQRNTTIETPIAWTGHDGRYTYPNVYVPPTGRTEDAGHDVFGPNLGELEKANLLIIAATGNRPKKLRVGENKGGDTTFLHDDYFMPIQAIRHIGLSLDGDFTGYMMQCLDLYGQAAGRGPSIKDLAQKRKGEVEDFGLALQKTDNNYLKLLGLIIRAANREEADIRQWRLLPNSIHVWMQRVQPGSHRIVLLPSGENVPSRDYYFIDRAVAPVLQQTEINYVRMLANAPARLFAPRHVRSLDVKVPDTGLAVVFVAEAFNLEAKEIAVGAPKEYELLPRRVPPKQ
ncbi:MAG TPA: hypothetical protein VJZ71_20445 [Phycisphaerae bacterium]|nr:hypothetical protein [Phycisphaerae bacterium]